MVFTGTVEPGKNGKGKREIIKRKHLQPKFPLRWLAAALTLSGLVWTARAANGFCVMFGMSPENSGTGTGGKAGPRPRRLASDPVDLEALLVVGDVRLAFLR